MTRSFYDTLGVKKDSSPADIKRAYRDKAWNNHPDRGGDEKNMEEINRAYNVLKDPVSRIEYDRTGQEPKDTHALSRDLIMNIFIDILKMEQEPPDYIEYTRDRIRAVIRDLNKEIVKANAIRTTLKNKRNRITKRESKKKQARLSINMWHALIDQQLKAGEGIIAEIQHRRKAHEDALDILKDYYDGTDNSMYQFISVYSTSSTTGSTTGGY